MPHLSQSSVLAFYMLAAFIVFVTVRGELSTYVGFFVGGKGPSNPMTGPTSSATLSSASDQLSNAQRVLLEGAQLAIIA